MQTDVTTLQKTTFRTSNYLHTRQAWQIFIRVVSCIELAVERVLFPKDLIGQGSSGPKVCLGVVQHAVPSWLRAFDFWCHHCTVTSLVHLSRQVRKLQSVCLISQAAAEVTDDQERVVCGKEEESRPN